MKKRPLLQIVAALMIFLIAASCNQQPVDVSDEISGANEAFMESFNSGDMAAVALHYTEDAKLFPANSEIIEGREMIETFWGGAAEMGVKNVNLETIAADGFGNHAIEEGKYTLYADGDVIIDEGKYIVTWAKVDGKWLMKNDIWNTNYPVYTGKATLESGNVLGVHAYEISLKEDVTAEQFEKYYNEEYIPAVEENMPGVKLYLLKGERGEYKGKYGAIIYFKSLEERDYWIPEPGTRSEKGKEAMELLQPYTDKLNEMISYKSKYTDWIIQ